MRRFRDIIESPFPVPANSSNGLMSSTDKSKLNNIAENANNCTLPNAASLLRGGVLMGAAVPDTAVDGTETAAVNALLASLRAAGMLNP